MLRVGCAGFPVGMDRYWRTLPFAEALTGEAMPRPATLAGWRAAAPAGAEFAVQACRLITHGREDRGFPPAGRRLAPPRQRRCGWFRDGVDVREAWAATRAAAEALDARIVVFETPASFLPGPDRLRDMYRFFRDAPRGRLTAVWQPGEAWEGAMVRRICADLGLTPAVDPLRRAVPASGGLLYIRPRGLWPGGMSVDELSTIARAVRGRPACAVFSHRAAFRDAERLAAMTARPDIS